MKQFIATKALINHRGKILVLRESKRYGVGTNIGKFDVVGGRINSGENYEQSLLREIKEETGLDVKINKVFSINEWYPNVNNEQWQVIGMFFECLSDTDKVILSQDHDEYKWIKPEEYKEQNLIENLHKIFDQYINLKKKDEARLAAKAFIIKDGKLLVLKRASNDIHLPGIWEPPGGRLELGENPFIGLKREVKEESGLDIEILNPLSVRHFTRQDNQKITMLIFLCKSINDEVKLSEEHSEYDWLPIDSCKKKLADFFHPEVDTYLNFFRAR